METIFTIRFIITIIVVLLLIYILIRFRANRTSTKSSLDIMKERLEKGEITEKDYQRAKRRQGKE